MDFLCSKKNHTAAVAPRAGLSWRVFFFLFRMGTSHFRIPGSTLVVEPDFEPHE